MGHRVRDHPPEGHHGAGREVFEKAIKHQDLRPVGLVGGGGFVMRRGDCRLNLERSDRLVGECAADESKPFVDVLVAAAVLVVALVRPAAPSAAE